MTAKVLLVGFIADLRGNEGCLLSADLIVRVGGVDHVASGFEWKMDSLVPLEAQERTFIQTLKPDDQVRVSPGDLVWLAGPELVSDLAALPALWHLSLDSRFHWYEFAQGFKWRIGAIDEYLDLRSRTANQLELLLHRCLFAGLNARTNETRLFTLYSAMDAEPSRNRSINRGLFYLQGDDAYGLAMTEHRGVQSGLFCDAVDFRASLDDARRRLARRN